MEEDGNKIYNYVPTTTLAASIATAFILHYYFPLTTLSVPAPFNLLGLFVIGFGLYLAFQSIRLLMSSKTTIEPS